MKKRRGIDMKKKLPRYFQIILLSFLSSCFINTRGEAQDSLTSMEPLPPIRMLQVGYTAGPIIVHSSGVQNTKGAYPHGYEFTMAWQRNDQKAWNACGCSPSQGVQLAFYEYDNKALGRSLNLSYVLEPTYRLSKRSSFSYKAILGAAYMSNPYDSGTNQANQSYSTTINGFLGLGVGYWRQLSNHWSAGGQIEFHHISNGGLHVPNKGINWPTASVTLRYRMNPRPLQLFHREPYLKSNRLRYDFSIFGVTKKVPDGTDQLHALVGLAIQAAKQVGRINYLTLGTEVFWDNALRSHLQQDNSGLDPWRVGILVGHEFFLGRLVLSQRLGAYLYQAGNYYDPVFHQWGVSYRVFNHWSLGTNLKVHRQVADYADLRFTYTL